MAEPEVTRAAPNHTTSTAEIIGEVPDNGTAEKAGTTDTVRHIGPSL